MDRLKTLNLVSHSGLKCIVKLENYISLTQYETFDRDFLSENLVRKCGWRSLNILKSFFDRNYRDLFFHQDALAFEYMEEIPMLSTAVGSRFVADVNLDMSLEVHLGGHRL